MDRIERQVDLGSMASWRKREIALGLARSALTGRVGRNALPIRHRDVRIRESFGDVVLGRLCEIHERCVLSSIGSRDRRARLEVGARTSIWYGTVISARHEITIGADCAISWGCTILDNDMHEIIPADGKPARVRGDHVRIADHVWIGAGTAILKGVTIGESAVIGAGSVVTKDVAPRTLVAGSPARLVSEISGWR